MLKQMNCDTLSYLQTYLNANDFKSFTETCTLYATFYRSLSLIMPLSMHKCEANVKRDRKRFYEQNSIRHKLSMFRLQNGLRANICGSFITHVSICVGDSTYLSTINIHGHLPHLHTFSLNILIPFFHVVKWSNDNYFALSTDHVLCINLPLFLQTLKVKSIRHNRCLRLHDQCVLKRLILFQCDAQSCENIQTLQHLEIDHLLGKFTTFPSSLKTLIINKKDKHDDDLELVNLPSSLTTLFCPLTYVSKILEPLPSSLKRLRMGTYHCDYALPDTLEYLELRVQTHAIQCPSSLKELKLFVSLCELIVSNQIQHLTLGSCKNIVVSDDVWRNLKTLVQTKSEYEMDFEHTFSWRDFTYIPPHIQRLTLPHHLKITNVLPKLEYLEINDDRQIDYDLLPNLKMLNGQPIASSKNVIS